MRRVLLSGALAAVLAALCGCIDLAPLVAGDMKEVVVEESPRFFEINKIALIDVDGLITASPSVWMPRHGAAVADVREKLQRAADDPRVVAVVLRINSPGGEVAASDMIHQEILRFKKETERPVVAMLMGLATSGGYYVATAADTIVVSPTTVTGSVGVIMQFVSIEGLFNKIGVEAEVVKSGAMKDIASPMRRMTDEERHVLQEINESMFERFIAVVRESRPVTDADLRTIRDGRILSAGQAVDLHLADRIGYLDDALQIARIRAGVGGADVVLYRPFPHYNTNIYAGALPASGGVLEHALQLLLKQQGAAFLYLWEPGLANR